MRLSEQDITFAASLLGEDLRDGLTDRHSAVRALLRFGAVPVADPASMCAPAWVAVRLAGDKLGDTRVVRMQLTSAQQRAVAFVVRRWACARTELRAYIVAVVAHGARSLERRDRAEWVARLMPGYEREVMRAHGVYRDAMPRPDRLLRWAREAVEVAVRNHPRTGDADGAGRELSIAFSAGGYALPFAMRTLAAKASVPEESLMASLHLPPPELFDTIPGDFLAMHTARDRSL